MRLPEIADCTHEQKNGYLHKCPIDSLSPPLRITIASGALSLCCNTPGEKTRGWHIPTNSNRPCGPAASHTSSTHNKRKTKKEGMMVPYHTYSLLICTYSCYSRLFSRACRAGLTCSIFVPSSESEWRAVARCAVNNWMMIEKNDREKVVHNVHENCCLVQQYEDKYSLRYSYWLYHLLIWAHK